MMAMTDFGVATLQKLQTCRYRTEKIAYCDCCSLRRSGNSDFRELPIRCPNLCALLHILLPTQYCYLGHSCNTGQRLTSKTKRTNMFQIVDLLYLACRVACQSQVKFFLRNSRSIISYTDQLQPTMRQIHANLGCFRINTIFN